MISYSATFQEIQAAYREKVRSEVQQMGEAIGKPMEITDEVLNDIAVTFMGVVLAGGAIVDGFAAAYQAAYAIQNEH